ncbi:MAG: hypothetical protein Q8O23_02130 [Gallionella sp.]|nr:hypothetical protein [Gallionella sp.]
MGIGEFCSHYNIADASESSKELHRLTLPPSKDPNDVRLRRGAGKYRLLIEAISKITNESVSPLADRVLLGTSLHPAKQIGSLSEAEKLQTALQRIVDKIDDEFGLHAKFMETAKLKAKHIADGGKENWPLWEVTADMLTPEEYEMERCNAADPRFAFWMKGIGYETWIKTYGATINGTEFPNAPGSGALQNNNFFFIPHAPLGVIEFANLPNRRQAPVQYERAVQDQLDSWRQINKGTGRSLVAREHSIRDDWDSAKLCPIGQLNQSDGSSCGSDFAWLIIYPAHDGSRLMPMLYIAHEEGGAYILPLDARNLEIFRDAVWLNETEHMSVFDRIKELLGYRTDTLRHIEDGFRRTAPWLDHNPFFKMKQQHADDLQMLDAFCQKLWEEK